MKRIGCFHAHYSNIELIEKAMNKFDVELVHFVDPGLDRLKGDRGFTKEMMQKKVMETLDWISNCHVDAILLTCTMFTSIFNENDRSYTIPIIKIDEPLFGDICKMNQPVIAVFTNPNTVNGTMKQLLAYTKVKGTAIDVEPFLLDHTFELIMQGRSSEYIQAVSEGLMKIMDKYPEKNVVAAQLSMAPAAHLVEKQRGSFVGNHLVSLSDYMQEMAALEPKS